MARPRRAVGSAAPVGLQSPQTAFLRMLPPPRPADEGARLATLHALRILDTGPDDRFDTLTRLAARLFDVPMALVSLIDAQRQWFKSCVGLPVRETSREVSFCGHAILGDEPFVVEDALADPRFADNPLVAGEPHIRFYAGCPIAAADGHRLGTLCVIDRRPRGFPESDRALLADLAHLAELELRSLALAVERDRTEATLRTSEARLREQEACLRDAARQKDEFLATLAHELRNPLAPIRAAAHVIRLRQPSDAMVLRARDTIERQTTHLAHMVDDLLDVARITQGRMALQRRPESVLTLVADAIDAARPAIDAAGHALTVNLPPESMQVHADATRVAQALQNLLNNAVKYTPDGGRIDVTVRRDAAEVCIAVQDNGVGIPAADRERIFGLFIQDPDSRQRRQGGLGIGLALARRVIELHGGRVTADSPGPGQGSTFTLALPLLEAAEHEEPPGAVPAGGRRRRRILVVDDSPDGLESTRLVLELEGHEVHVAATGREAIEAALGQRFELVLLDIGLPDMDGYRVARELQARCGADVPVLAAMTGWGQPSDRQRARDAGFAHHFTKPVDPYALEDFVERLEAHDLPGHGAWPSDA
jgi:signal transduction histidine kinase